VEFFNSRKISSQRSGTFATISVTTGGYRIAGLASGYVQLTDKSSPEILKPIHGQFGIADGMLDVFMTDIVLQRASIVAIVGELVSAGVPEHVRVDAEWHLRGLAEALNEPVEAYGAHRPTALRNEYVGV
jgi:hypothetical protein